MKYIGNLTRLDDKTENKGFQLSKDDLYAYVDKRGEM